MNDQKIIKLAKELIKIRINAYWSYQDEVSKSQWKNKPGDQALKEWSLECKHMAEIILKEIEPITE